MARTISEIQQEMVARIAERLSLSASAVAEWRLWTFVVAGAIHAFEVVMDAFRAEVEDAADKITPGTLRWYAEQARRFQNGYNLTYDPETAQLYYAQDDPDARIVTVVAVSEGEKELFVKVAKTDAEGHISPLTGDELYNFSAYLDAIKFAGIETTAISTTADSVRYRMTVYHDPVYSATAVREGVLAALDTYRDSIGFDSRLYSQQLIGAVLATPGVVTVDVASLERKATGMEDYVEVGVADDLHAGYFDYAADSSLEVLSAAQMPL